MCGIAGFFNASVAVEQRASIMQEMLRLIAHRGPDEMGFYSDEQITFGNVRLSIIDIASGQQPLCDSTRRYWICYNGEVYNYRELAEQLRSQGYPLRTYSDTEVVLYAWIAWGARSFERLNGAFAFAIYDSLEKNLVLVRDRFGKRPLFYSQGRGGELLFASELKAFLAYPNVQFAFDEARLASIFYLWTPLQHETAFQNFAQVPEGCYMQVSQGHKTIHSYAELDFAQAAYAGNEAQAASEARARLQQSVRLRMRSDVEVGLYLSGGLDSAIIAKLAAEETAKPLHSFSIAFTDKDYDESAKQRLLSDYLGTQHTSLTINHSDIANAFPAAVWHAEVPQFRTALVPMYLLAQQVRAQGVKVVLTGEGSDEAFLGYDIFKETLLRQLMQASPESATVKLILENLYPYLNHFQQANNNSLLSVFRQHLTENTPGLFSHEVRFHNSKFAMRLLAKQTDPLAGLSHLFQPALQAKLSLTQRAQWLEFKTLLAGYLLSSQGDRMSLAHGVEGRSPFLDANVVNFAHSLPQAFKLKDYQQEKYILKQAFKNELPSSILQQPKQPYRAPDAVAFLTGTPPDYLDLILSTDKLNELGFIDVRFCQQLLKKLTANPMAISPRENQAFIQLLSVALLQHFFINKQFPAPTIKPSMTVQQFGTGDARQSAVHEN
jgi:asparagine synthase (glutamine-hydrolysing)